MLDVHVYASQRHEIDVATSQNHDFEIDCFAKLGIIQILKLLFTC